MKIMKKTRLTVLFLILISIFTLFSACIQEQEKDLIVRQGERIKWIKEEECIFSSSNENIAIVDQEGYIYGINIGSCTVKAVCSNKEYIVKVVVIGRLVNSQSKLGTQQSQTESICSEIISNSINQSSFDSLSPSILTSEDQSQDFSNSTEIAFSSEEQSLYQSSLQSTAQTSSLIPLLSSTTNSSVIDTTVSSQFNCSGDNSEYNSTGFDSIGCSQTFINSSQSEYSSIDSLTNFQSQSSLLSSSIEQSTEILSSSLNQSFDISFSVSNDSSQSSLQEKQYYLDANGGIIESSEWEYYQGIYTSAVSTSFPLVTKTGYNFIGWFYENGEQALQLDFNQVLIAHWEEITYKIDYILNEGINNEDNPILYSYFQENILLFEPSKQGCQFDGWYLDSDFTQRVEFVPNLKSDITLYAKFVEVNTMQCVYEGNIYYNETIKGEKFSRPNVIVEDGYFIEWFIDEGCTTSYNFSTISTNDITVYGKKYKELTSSFFGYENNQLTEINSLEEFQYYLEYTFFHQIKTENFVKLNIDLSEYFNDSTKLSELLNKTTMPFIQLSRSTKTVDGDTYFQAKVVVDVPQNFYTQEGKGSHPQLNYIGYGEDLKFVSQRSETFDEFAYKDFIEQVEVTNSNQLFFALEHRVEPIPQSGSNAEIALNKCKAILREICDDSMSDKEKVIAIYKYIIMNTEYVMPSVTTVPEVLCYDAFYMEGVLNNGSAVCDGLAKTVSALCNIEGIRCVRTASSSHAWNEVFVDGQWLVVDTTHGNIQFGSNEILSFGNCFINENLKEQMSYTDVLRTEIIADGELNVYEELTFEVNDIKYDYVISNQTELTALFEYCLEQATQNSYSTFTVEILLDFSQNTFSQQARWAATVSGINQKYTYSTYSLSSKMANREILFLVFS